MSPTPPTATTSTTPTPTPTPPSLYCTKLASSSPSSARLQRIAPKPIRVPPTPPLYFASPPACRGRRTSHTALFSAKSDLPKSAQSEDPFEYDFEPLEQAFVLDRQPPPSRNMEGWTSPPRREMRMDSMDSNASIPLVFDTRGRLGVLPERNRSWESRGLEEPDVPEELEMWEEDDDAEESPFRYDVARASDGTGDGRAREVGPHPVLVQFRQDVFGASSSSSRPLPSRNASGATACSSLPSHLAAESRDDSVAESFYTFGRPDRRPSTTSVLEDDDGWSYTLSAYGGDDDDEHLSPRAPGRVDPKYIPPALTRHATPQTGSGSPSSGSHIFTPDYCVSSLPQSEYTDFSSPFSPPTAKLPSESPPSPRSRQRRQQAVLDVKLARDAANLYESPSPQSPPSYHSRTPSAASAKPPFDKNRSLPPLPQQTNEASPRSKAKQESLDEMIRRNLKAVDKSTTVTLFVDQEGAREVLTTLKFMRTIKPQVFRDREQRALETAAMWCESPSRPEMFQQSGCVEFGTDPRSRPKWTFHHAALESLPVLRRLTVNDDEKHDYLTKGATLQIKDVGVYAVYGTEDKGRVEWKFEYLIQPRISGSTGETVQNEKFVIPLGFYVSPNFFNPDRALKLHLINVFKKQLTPNIVSEKVKPPHLGTPPPRTAAAPSPAPSTGGAMSKALEAIVKAVGSRSNAGTPATPDTACSLPPSESKKGRKRAATLFSRSRPFTPPVNIEPVPFLSTKGRPNTTSHFPGSAPTSSTSRLTPMKSLSNLHRAHSTETPSPLGTAPPLRKTLAPMKSLSALTNRPRTAEDRPPMPKAMHPFATHVHLVPAPRSAALAERNPNQYVPEPGMVFGQNEKVMRFQAKGGFAGPRSGSEDSLKVPGLAVSTGLSPSPRACKKRPSTAEPRVGLR